MGTESFHLFNDRFAESLGPHADTIRAFLGVDCVKVEPASKRLDKQGIDFIATLRTGGELNIDIKVRTPGCSQFWVNGEPQLALEIWSEIPTDGNSGRLGWTRDGSKLTDFTLHVFDPADTLEVFFLPFQLLRQVFCDRFEKWRSRFRCVFQRSQNFTVWRSECMFIPACVVIEAITEEMRRLPTRSK